MMEALFDFSVIISDTSFYAYEVLVQAGEILEMVRLLLPSFEGGVVHDAYFACDGGRAVLFRREPIAFDFGYAFRIRAMVHRFGFSLRSPVFPSR